MNAPAERVRTSKPRELLDEAARLQDTRWLVVSQDPVVADALACALRNRGAAVHLIDTELRGLPRLHSCDAQLVLVDSDEGPNHVLELAARVHADPRLRSANLLATSWRELWPEGESLPDVEKLCELAAPHVHRDFALREAALSSLVRFEQRLETMSPARILRSLRDSSDAFHVAFEGSECAGSVNLVGDLVLDARFEHPSTQLRSEGMDALFDLLVMREGEARITRHQPPRAHSLALSLNEVLELAVQHERPREPAPAPDDSSPTRPGRVRDVLELVLSEQPTAAPPAAGAGPSGMEPNGGLPAVSAAATWRPQARSGVVGRQPRRSETVLPPPADDEQDLRIPVPISTAKRQSAPAAETLPPALDPDATVDDLVLPRLSSHEAPSTPDPSPEAGPQRLHEKKGALTSARPAQPHMASGSRRRRPRSAFELEETWVSRPAELLAQRPGSRFAKRALLVSAVALATGLALWHERGTPQESSRSLENATHPSVRAQPAGTVDSVSEQPPKGAAPEQRAPADSPKTPSASRKATAKDSARKPEDAERHDPREQSDHWIAQASDSQDPAERLSLLRRALQVDERNPHAWAALASTLRDQGDLEAAAEAAAEAVDLRKRRTRYRVLYADLLRAQGDREAAAEQLEIALEIEPDSAFLKNRLDALE